jgi:hypothetical protein
MPHYCCHINLLSIIYILTKNESMVKKNCWRRLVKETVVRQAAFFTCVQKQRQTKVLMNDWRFSHFRAFEVTVVAQTAQRNQLSNPSAQTAMFPHERIAPRKTNKAALFARLMTIKLCNAAGETLHTKTN